MEEADTALAILRGLHHALRLTEEAGRAKTRADDAMEEAVTAALAAGYPKTRIMREAKIAESRLRAIRDKHGISPDPRYAHLKPPPGGKKEGSA
ncbi:MAG TPA: hypothetical protein VFU74_21805 [Actinocrinis sp.]|nr:hypothetical protein [Actinocrinis sp.]